MNSTLFSLPVLVLYPHRRCNCRCVMCDIWKDRSEDEISADDLQRHMLDIRQLNVKWVVLSGGEPREADTATLGRSPGEAVRVTGEERIQ